MLALLAALALIPWSQLAFEPEPGWRKEASGTVHLAYMGHGRRIRVPTESAAWTA